MKKLLVLTSTYPRWADDSEPAFVHELCIRLTSDFDVTVLAPHTEGAAKQETLDGVNVQRFRYAPIGSQQLCYQGGILNRLRQRRWRYLLLPLFIFSAWYSAWRLCKKNNIDVIHAHWLIPMGWLTTLPGLRHSPCLMTSHGGDLFAKGGLLSFLRRKALHRANAITAVSNAMREKLSADIQQKTHVLPMGTDLQNQFVPSETAQRDPLQLVFVGRLVDKKGVDQLLQALALLNRPDVMLEIIGDGPLRDDLEQSSTVLGISQQVSFLGSLPHSELPKHLQRAALCIVPSVVAASGDQEGFGLVIVEAMGCGCPVLVCDLPAVRDIVIHCETGLLCDCQPASLAENIAEVLNNPNAAKTRAANARQRATQQFDWQAIGQRYASQLMRMCEDLSNRA